MTITQARLTRDEIFDEEDGPACACVPAERGMPRPGDCDACQEAAEDEELLELATEYGPAYIGRTS